jgi:hypothetical protein
MKIFNDEFLKIDDSEIWDQVSRNGYYTFNNAITEEFISSVEKIINLNRTEFNKNWPTGVDMTGQFFYTHLLILSKEIFEYICSDKIYRIATKILKTPFVRLKAMRYYETYGGFHMQWHTDNKTDKSLAHIPGLIVICYLSDVNEGEFQYIRGSHLWSGEKAYSDYTDEYVDLNFSNEIVSFKKRKGAIIIYNTYGIHRACPVKNKNYLRKSIFFQIDGQINNGEPILLNPTFCGNLKPELKNYLGFGLPSEYGIFPNSRLKDHPLYLSTFKKLTSWIFYRCFRAVYEKLPFKIKIKIKNLKKYNNKKISN